MYGFFEENGNLNLTANGVVFKNISLLVNRTKYGKVALDLECITENEAVFSSDFARATISIKEENNVLALAVKGELIISSAKKMFCDKAEDCLDADGAVYINFAKAEKISAFNASVLTTFWTSPTFGKDLKDIPKDTQALLYKTNSDYGLIYTPCGNKYKSMLEGAEKGFSVKILSLKQGLCSFDEIVLLLSTDSNPFVLPDRIAAVGMKLLGKKVLPIEQKKYPDILEYLGWCSWDAFPLCVTHGGLLEKAEEFKCKQIPIRWVMIDDMWSELDGENSRKVMHDRKLRDFKADLRQFPKGLKAAVLDLKSKYKLKVGVWHPITGYWRGFAPDGAIAKKYGELLIETEGERLAIRPTKQAMYEYHNEFYGYLKKSGVDFVKVDNQSSLSWFYRHIGTIGEMSAALHSGIEEAVDKHFGGDMINCMGCANENIWNRPKSLVNRCSADFLPENKEWFINHILQCTTTVYFYSPFFCGDFDMFWTDDAQGKRNAVLRAISGGPIYVSDKVNRSIAEILMPCVLADGKILRCKKSAKPTADCLVNDPTSSDKAYTVWNVTNEGLVAASFNLNQENKPVLSRIAPFEILNTDAEFYAAYNFHSEQLKILKRGEAVEGELSNQEAFVLCNFVPVKNGVAPIGLKNKYVSSATFERLSGNKFLVKNGGEFLFYAEAEPKAVKIDGETATAIKKDNYFIVDLGEVSKEHIVEIVF